MNSLKNKQNLFKGVLFFMTAILVISVVDTICKLFTKELHAIQIVWGYFIGINLTLWVFFFLKGEKLSKLKITERSILQILRPAFLVCSISCLFVGLTYLPLAEATAIGFVPIPGIAACVGTTFVVDDVIQVPIISWSNAIIA